MISLPMHSLCCLFPFLSCYLIVPMGMLFVFWGPFVGLGIPGTQPYGTERKDGSVTRGWAECCFLACFTLAFRLSLRFTMQPEQDPHSHVLQNSQEYVRAICIDSFLPSMGSHQYHFILYFCSYRNAQTSLRWLLEISICFESTIPDHFYGWIWSFYSLF